MPYFNRDQFIKLILSICIIVHFAVFILTFTSKKFLQFVSVLNGAVAAGIIFYWPKRQMRYEKFDFHSKEMLVLIFELILLLISIYTLIKPGVHQWIKLTQCISFGIHLIILVFLLCFMNFFKMNQLI